MRDIINTIDSLNLSESTGLANRRVNDRFVDSLGNELLFRELNFYPESGQYADADERDRAVTDIANEIGVDPDNIKWVTDKRPGADMLGFGLAHFVDSEGKEHVYGKYFKSINPIRNKNFFDNKIDGTFKFQSRSAKKESAGYKPSEVLTEFENQTPAALSQQVRNRFGENSSEAAAFDQFLKASNWPVTIPVGNMNADAFVNYFSELMHPAALVLGMPTTGNAQDAEQIFFRDAGFGSCTITFNRSTTGGLYDSLLINRNGKQIQLSTKAQNGADASVVNLLEAVEELKSTPEGAKLTEQYQDSISLVEIIKDGGHVDGCLNLAMLYNIIDEKEKQQVKSLKDKTAQDDVLENVAMSNRLKEIYRSRVPRSWDKVVPLEHALAAIATKVVDHVNNKTNFSDAASDILNHSALIQVYTKARVAGDNIILDKFHCEYPSKTVTGVLLKSDKTYSSTVGKGNFVFRILKNNASAEDVAILDTQTTVDPDATAIDPQVRPRAPEVKAAAAAIAKPAGEKELGRRRRRP